MYYKLVSIFLLLIFLACNVLGALNKGVYVLMTGLDLERLGACAGPTGYASLLFRNQ